MPSNIKVFNKHLPNCWASEDIDAIERKIIDMTYVRALMYLTVEEDFNYFVCIDWINTLAAENPGTLLEVSWKYGYYRYQE